MNKIFYTLLVLVIIGCTNSNNSNKQMDTESSKLPYPKSSVIKTFKIDSNRISIGHGDNWAITWADNGKQFSFFTDGEGFGAYPPKDENHIEISTGLVELIGEPENLIAKDLPYPTSTIIGKGGQATKKVCGLIMINKVLYAWVRNLNLPDSEKGTGSTMIYSLDYGQTWKWTNWNFPEIGYPTWLNAGKNYTAAKDDYAYFISPDGPSAYADYPYMLMGRVHIDSILVKEAYLFYAGLEEDNNPLWLGFNNRYPILNDNGGCFRPDFVYNPAIDRYLLSVCSPYGDWSWWANENPDRTAHFAIYDAPNPWGPWTTTYYEKDWGKPENRFAPHIAPKWISDDGKTIYLIHSATPVGPYRFNVIKCHIELYNKD